MTPAELNDMIRGFMFRHGKYRRAISKNTRTREEMRKEWQYLKRKFKVI